MTKTAAQIKEKFPIDDSFQVESIAKSEPPDGAEKDNWYRYVIIQGGNTIVGHRPGSLRSVTQAVEEVVGRLNERRFGKRGRVHLTSSPKKRG
ncbi:MAG: hypothetical protein ACWGPN_04725 [Gammaproteobacteria bacterium]|jgi:hypothetical protein